MCVQDNEIIFEITSQEKVEIPRMSLTNDYWQASHHSYKNSLTKIKMKGNLSREIEEKL